MKHISINVSEEIKNLLPDKLEKDLMDNEIICPVCRGLGILKKDYHFGVNDEEFKVNWYDNEYLTICPNCYFGRIKLCEFCGKPLNKGSNRCNCDGYKEKEEEERKVKYKDLISKAKEIDLKDASYYMYDEKSEQYFADEDEFSEHYWDLYLDNEKEYDYDFDSYFEKHVPKILWNCEEVKISMSADSIINDACDELHEDARYNIEGKDELQYFLNHWCEKQTGTTTYYPCYKEYVKVQKEWFT